MIECCRLPAVCRVTLTAICAKTALMGVVIKMTGIAIPQSHREILQPARIDMTLDAGNANVLACELERKGIVIEISSEAICAIMTVETR